MTLYGIVEEASRPSKGFPQEMLPKSVKWLKGNNDSILKQGENERNISEPSQ